MKKKIRVDFSAHCSVVVSVEEGDEMYDEAVSIAENYVQGNSSIEATWELDDDGVEDVDDYEESVNE